MQGRTTQQRPILPAHVIRQNEPGYAKNVYQNPARLSDWLYGLKATVITHEWITVEPERRRYDFSVMDAQVERLVTHHPDVSLVFQLSDQSYTTYEHESPPLWLVEARVRKVAQAGWVAATWHESVMDELIRLHLEVNHRYRDVEQFLGTATGETTVGLRGADEQAMVGYTAQKRLDTLERLAKTISTAFPHKRLFFYQNFLQGGSADDLLEMLLRIVEPPYDVAIGGPDLLPHNDALQRMVHPNYPKLPPYAHKFGSCQYDDFRQSNFDDVITLARSLGMQTIIWNNARWTTPKTIDDALPYFDEQLSELQPYRPPPPVPPEILADYQAQLDRAVATARAAEQIAGAKQAEVWRLRELFRKAGGEPR